MINILKSKPTEHTNLLRTVDGGIYGVPQIIGPVRVQIDSSKNKRLYKLTSLTNDFPLQHDVQPTRKLSNTIVSAQDNLSFNMINGGGRDTDDRIVRQDSCASKLPKIQDVFSLASDDTLEEKAHVDQLRDFFGSDTFNEDKLYTPEEIESPDSILNAEERLHSLRSDYNIGKSDYDYSGDRTVNRIGSCDSGISSIEDDHSNSSFEVNEVATATNYGNIETNVAMVDVASEANHTDVRYNHVEQETNHAFADGSGISAGIHHVRPEITDILTQTEKNIRHNYNNEMPINYSLKENVTDSKVLINTTSMQTNGASSVSAENTGHLTVRNGTEMSGAVDNGSKNAISCHDMPSLSDSIESDSLNFDHTTYTKTSDFVCNHTDVQTGRDHVPVSARDEAEHEMRDDENGCEKRHRLKIKLRWNKRWTIERKGCSSPFISCDSTQPESGDIHVALDDALLFCMTSEELAIYSPKIDHVGSMLTVVMKKKRPRVMLRKLNNEYMRC